MSNILIVNNADIPKPKKYVYVVVGICHDYDGEAYLVLSDYHGCHSSLAKARSELSTILDEIRDEANDNGYSIDYDIHDDTLTINFETGTVEVYEIRKMCIN